MTGFVEVDPELNTNQEQNIIDKKNNVHVLNGYVLTKRYIGYADHLVGSNFKRPIRLALTPV